MKKILILFLVGIVGVVVGVVGGCRFCRCDVGVDVFRCDTVVETVFDTVVVAKDSVVVRWVERTLKVADDEGREGKESHEAKLHGTVADEGSGDDSVRVVVPISQKVYEGADYRAYVSGYESRLDSISINRRIVERTVTMEKKKTRFNIGVIGGFGYGLLNSKPDVFVGLGVSYRLFD